MRSAVRQAFRWRHFIPWLILFVGLLLTYIFLASISLLDATSFKGNFWEWFFIQAFFNIGTIAVLFAPLFAYFFSRITLKIILWLVASLLTLYYSLHLFTVFYLLRERMAFDFFYYWLNRDVAYETLANAYPLLPLRLLMVAIAALCFIWALVAAKKQIPKPNFFMFRFLPYPLVIVWALVFATFFTPLRNLIYDARVTYNIMQVFLYDSLYKESLTTSIPTIPASLATNNSIIFLHLETVNSSLVTPTSTPVLFEQFAHGTLLRKHHSGAVQTHRAEEVIICGALPSLFRSESITTYKNITDYAAEQHIDLACLPEILRQAGYKTLFFKSHDLAFQRTREFMPLLGFDEIHDQHDIMKPGDPLLKWGAREDIFYKRVVEYIANNYSGQKVFAYIAVSSTNHHPWDRESINTREDVLEAMPDFTGDKKLLRRKQSLFTQDMYLRDFFEAYENAFSFNNTDVFIFGDHPMPLAREKIEQFVTAAGVVEESFLTVFGFLPARNHAHEFAHNAVLAEDIGTSHADIAPTVLELLGIQNPYRFGDSLYSILTGELPLAASCSFNVMPYYGAAISLVQYPNKIIVNLFEGKIEYVNLEKADEKRRTIKRNVDGADAFFEACRRNSLTTILSNATS